MVFSRLTGTPLLFPRTYRSGRSAPRLAQSTWEPVRAAVDTCRHQDERAHLVRPRRRDLLHHLDRRRLKREIQLADREDPQATRVYQLASPENRVLLVCCTACLLTCSPTVAAVLASLLACPCPTTRSSQNDSCRSRCTSPIYQQLARLRSPEIYRADTLCLPSFVQANSLPVRGTPRGGARGRVGLCARSPCCCCC